MMEMKKIFLRIIGLGCMGLLMPLAVAYGDQQIVSVSPSSPAFGESDESVVLAIKYATDPVNSGATGLGLKIFYNGDLLKADDLVLNDDVGGTPTVGVADDAGDDDNDPSTDKKIIVAWLQKNTTGLSPEPIPWPEIDHTDGATLYELTFGRVDAAFTGKTTLNFQMDTAAGFDPLAESVDVIFKDDETPPEITLDGNSVSVEAGFPLTNEDNTPELAAFIATITVTDNKDTLTTDSLAAFVTKDGELVAAPEGFAPGTYEITLIASDSSGNESEGVVVTLTVTDTTMPVLSGVTDVTLSAVDKNGAPSAGILAASALDSVDGQVAVAYSVGGADVGANFPLGETTVTVKAADTAGNMAEGTLIVTVSDTTNPVIVSAAGVALEADGELGYGGSTASIIAAIGVSDNVDDAPAVTLGASVPEVLAFGVTQVGVVVTDAAGNATEGTVPVTVADTTKPEFSGANLLVLTVDAADEVVASDDARVTTWLAGVTATDIVDGATDVTNSALPSTFAVGEVVITFTSSDSRGNEATAEVTVLVTVGPAVTVADAITVVSLDGAAVPASQTQIAAFIAAASATDFSGVVLDVTNDAPDTFAIGDTLVTFSAVDADDRQGQSSSTVTVVAASAENDTDNDGMDDLFEVDNGLDPNADDAEADADGDGRSNLDEYLEGKDPNVDDVKPVVTAPADVATGATGGLTKADLGEATASDALDGDLTPVADNPGPYAPGSYTITWSATDAAGNTGLATQSVVISPQVSIAPKGRSAEGADYIVKATLNGPAPAYPVEIPVTLGGTAVVDSDYTVSTASIVIESGRDGFMTISVLSDDVEEGTESIEVTLGAPAANAVLGSALTSVISIVETQEPPALKLSVAQGAQNGRKVAAEGGAVIVSLSIVDPNGTHTVDWSASDSNLVATSDAGALTFEFDPAALIEGGYEVSAIVTDSGVADQTFNIGALIRVSAEAVDADTDGDGVPDSKDTSEETNVIAVDADAGTASVTADEGVKLVIGDAAQAAGTSGIAVSEETIAASGADGGEAPSNGDDEDFNYPAGVYDFQVQDLPVPGQSVRLTIPVASGIPADAVMRKYTEAEGWFDFVIDDNNGVASAAGEEGACPSVGSELYVDGLAEGDTCLQLTVQDGGPNDADGSVNGEYDDPSGIAEAAPVKVVIVPDTSNRKKVGGGCSVSEGGPGDFGLVFLALLGALGLFRKRLAASLLNR
jgi:hypothetical protein